MLAKSRLSSQESGEQCPYQPSSPHTFRGTAETTTTVLQRIKSKQQISVVQIDMIKLMSSEAESKEKHGEWDPMPELTIASPYVLSRVDSNTLTMGIGQPYARVDLKLMP